MRLENLLTRPETARGIEKPPDPTRPDPTRDIGKIFRSDPNRQLPSEPSDTGLIAGRVTLTREKVIPTRGFDPRTPPTGRRLEKEIILIFCTPQIVIRPVNGFVLARIKKKTVVAWSRSREKMFRKSTNPQRRRKTSPPNKLFDGAASLYKKKEKKLCGGRDVSALRYEREKRQSCFLHKTCCWTAYHRAQSVSESHVSVTPWDWRPAARECCPPPCETYLVQIKPQAM